MMILQVVTECGQPGIRASSAFEKGRLEIKKERGKKSTRYDHNVGNIEMLLRTVILLLTSASTDLGAKT